MKNLSPEKSRTSNIEKSLDNIIGRKPSKIGFFVILALYFTAYILLRIVSSRHGFINFAGQKISTSAFTGVFSSISNICIIILVVFYRKAGYITSLTLILLQFPIIIMAFFTQNNLNGIAGMFTNSLTMVAITIIYVKSQKVDEYQNRMRDQAVTDSLTSLPNRFACSELVNNLIKRGVKFALVHIDINGFKGINNTMGYEAGNKVLIEIAQRWKTIADTGISGTLDFVARVSGDEYVLIIRGYRSKTEILKTITNYESVLGNRLTIDDCDFFITASFGYAEYPSDAQSADSLFSYADTAMNEVKRLKSSNHILHFTPDLLKIEHTIEIEGKIRDALDNDTIFFHLQPQFDMSHKLRGFEALARMKDHDGKMISPAEFIPVAEKVGLIDKLDAAVYRKAAAFFVELRKKNNTDIILSVNASVRHLMKNDFLNEIRDLLQTSGLPAEQLEIEITESIMIDSAEKAIQCINELRNMGVKLAIDDFGTGYSSLSSLSNFPANLLKIDKSFIDKMNLSDSSKQYVAAIISLGHIMGYEVISEGVEEPDQLETLRNIGCDFIQGFIWGRPMPQEDAEKLVMDEINN